MVVQYSELYRTLVRYVCYSIIFYFIKLLTEKQLTDLRVMPSEAQGEQCMYTAQFNTSTIV